VIFEVVRPIRLKSQRGRVFHPGDRIDVDPEKARPLIDRGILRTIPDPSAAEKVDPVADFKARNIAVRIRSAVLGEDVWLVSNEAVRAHLKSEGLVCYLPEEIELMKNLSPEVVQRIHLLKKQFGGLTRIIGQE